MSARALARYAEDLVDQLDDIETAHAADEAVKVMRQATARVLGGDLSMSGLHGGAARIESKGSRRNQVVVTMSGGAYTLADKGRRRAVPAKAKLGRALSTPWGPRMSVRGSTTRGHDITGSAGPKALEAAAEQIIDDLEWGN